MKHLIILGAGGQGREYYNYATGCIGYGSDFTIKGFLDINSDELRMFNNYPPILGNDDNYSIQSDDIFVCSIGNLPLRQRVVKKMKTRGAVFATLIHRTSFIESNVLLGEGTVIQPYAQLGADTIIGNYVMIQSFVVVGHDAVVGDFSRIDCHVTLVGGVKVGNGVCIHTGAVISHRVIVEDEACVGANSFVIRRVRKGSTVYGNPAIEL